MSRHTLMPEEGRNGASHLVQTDFGPILETMMGAYNALLPSVHQSLEDNGAGLRDHAEALKATARDFTLTEDGVVRRHQSTGVDGRDGSSSFFDVADTTIRRAGPTETSLPQVSFGFPYDTVCDLVRMLTGFDIRAELSEKIGGDVVGASSQGSSFGSLGTSMGNVASNLRSGSSTITGSWSGGASEAAVAQIGTWVGSLDTQACQLVSIGRTVVQICRDAWQTALAVVQCVTSAVQTVSSALATMSVPGVGWARVVQAVYQAFQAVMKAYQAIMKLINILKQVTSLIETVKSFFDGDAAPVSTPTAPASTGQPSSITRNPRTVTTPTVGHTAPVAPSAATAVTA
ncbi:MAG: WXG100 family type VII secretion target [Nocardioides sp.]|nr:WXG100 family type VII secretion target [Nocardioides sp.]